MIFTPRDLAEPWNPTIKIGPQTPNLVLAISSSQPFSRWVFLDFGLVVLFNSQWEDQCVSVQTRKCIWPLGKSTKTIVPILYSQPPLCCAFQVIEWSQGALWTLAIMLLFQDEDKRVEVQPVPMYEELPAMLHRCTVCHEPVFSEDRQLKIRFFLLNLKPHIFGKHSTTEPWPQPFV